MIAVETPISTGISNTPITTWFSVNRLISTILTTGKVSLRAAADWNLPHSLEYGNSLNLSWHLRIAIEVLV
jgi:hypothetical protein